MINEQKQYILDNFVVGFEPIVKDGKKIGERALLSDEGQTFLVILEGLIQYRTRAYQRLVKEVGRTSWTVTLKDGTTLKGKDYKTINEIREFEKDIIDIKVPVMGVEHHPAFLETRDDIQSISLRTRGGFDVISNELQMTDVYYKIITAYPDCILIKNIYPNGEIEIERK